MIGIGSLLETDVEAMSPDGTALAVSLVLLFIIVIAICVVLCYIKRDFVQSKYVDFKIKKNTLKAE